MISVILPVKKKYTKYSLTKKDKPDTIRTPQ
ncbi:MAG: hypothetical protein UT55_C0051G0005 [Candidatus Peregrinibacteria bacterium GW2011_GWE2_39_6]|nr:MAG: hypothetical protein UT55_C0051G0005 [Candidatus Peregrinibacteria bacterium GW2011_GWE2_39_6]